jgi:hypothetical protein
VAGQYKCLDTFVVWSSSQIASQTRQTVSNAAREITDGHTVYESFPIPLGWARPSPAVKNSFVTSISSLVQNAKITSTSAPFYSEFIYGNLARTVVTDASGATFLPSLPNLFVDSPVVLKREVEAVARPTQTPAPRPRMV